MPPHSAQFLPQIEAFRRCGCALLSDDSGPQSRAVLVAPAREISEDLVNRMLTLSGGLLMVTLNPRRASALMLSQMSRPTTRVGAAAEAADGLRLCVSVEAREGVTTGISAHDRAQTVRILGEESPNPRKLVSPGHIFPVIALEGGVLVRNALPEGAHDLVRIAFQQEAAAFIDLLDQNGEYMSSEAQRAVAEKHGLPHFSLTSLIRFRLENEKLIVRVAEARLPTRLAGEMRSYIYRSTIHSGEHLALIKGTIDPDKPILTRVQPEFTFSDVFGGDNPPSRAHLDASLRAIGERGQGVLIYLRRPAQGQLRDQVEQWRTRYAAKPAASMREYGLGAQILRDLGVQKIELLTGSRNRLLGIKSFGIEIVSQQALPLSNSPAH